MTVIGFINYTDDECEIIEYLVSTLHDKTENPVERYICKNILLKLGSEVNIHAHSPKD